MDSKENKKKEPWQIIIFIIAVLFIVFMWVKNDVVGICTTMPKEQVVPLIATTILVSLIKIAAIAGVVLIIKWIVGKINKK
jgi:antibiotic biosynthesis monooxygenase (ABM) superfamily enzyme